MRGFRTLLAMVCLVGIATPVVIGQDKKSKDQPAKMRGTLPANYGKLDLSGEQKQKIYEVRAKAKARIDDLEKQIEDVKDQERKDIENVLTAAQRTRLRDIILGKAPGDKK